MLKSIRVCRRCRQPVGHEARAHFRWGGPLCRRHRDLARKAAHHARERDPGKRKLVRALRATMEGRGWFMPFDLDNIGIEFGRDLSALAALMRELGPGDFDPETGMGTPGDGLLDEQVFTNHRAYKWIRHRRKSVAVPDESVAAEPVGEADGSPETHKNKPDGREGAVHGGARAILDTDSRKGKYIMRINTPCTRSGLYTTSNRYSKTRLDTARFYTA